MPREKPDLDGEPPKNVKGTVLPHFGIAVDNSGRIFGIGPGNPFLIIEDPTDKSLIFPLTIVAVSHNKLEFRCRCKQKDCTRRVIFKGKWEGRHPMQF